MSHPAYRDILTGLYNCQYFVGAIAAAGACRGCLRFESSLAWRVPIWCQLISSCMVVLAVWFIPESPRWLYSHGRREEAWDVITKYHGEGSRDNAYVHLQIREYEEAINLEGSDKKAWDFRALVNTKAARWRLMCVAIASFMSQWAQAGVTTYYIAGLLATAGITDTTRVLDVNLGNTVLSAGLAYLGSYLGPKFRRRPMMIGASIACSVRTYAPAWFFLFLMFYANIFGYEDLLCVFCGHNRSIHKDIGNRSGHRVYCVYILDRRLFQLWLDPIASHVCRRMSFIRDSC